MRENRTYGIDEGEGKSNQAFLLLYSTELNTPRPAGINILEFSIGQLYQRGILRIKKQVENGVFIFIISITDAGKELLEKSEFSMQPAY
jgi:hypothetical protein